MALGPLPPQSLQDPTHWIETLKAEFSAYRKSRHPGQRIPANLRKAFLQALKQGVPAADLQSACRVSARQIAQWQKRLQADDDTDAHEAIEEARVLAVLPSTAPHEPVPANEPAAEGTADAFDVELRIGPWRLRLGLDEGNPMPSRRRTACYR